MKSGIYKVSFDVELTNYMTEDEAKQAVMEMVEEMLQEEEFPEVELELLDGVDLDYTLEEEETTELNFG